ncbi:mediator complex subunit med18 [Fusarium denticulatum]|uniref:Mediator of RNA polymerase II transcription subunit 18 n=1 Tax=Fusarium denticulatum TaxID=48507 RepID=A0A8H5U1E6_9HYPO|nr:mediator complex subunit med18 [Fusarium denticulatum]
MHEIFLTALIEDKDFTSACAVLGGLTNMDPWESIQRVLYFQGPQRPMGISNQSSIEKPIRNNTGFLWKELHQNLTRQSFILQTRYDVLKDRDMGATASPMDLDATQGILRWTDFPDPPRGQPLLTQRKKVELWDQKKLPSIMRDNNHIFKTETIEEVYRFYRDDIEFCLTRHYFLQPLEHYTPMESKQQETIPMGSLPPWESLTPVDQQKRWFLQVKAHVVQDNKPDEIRKAQDQLLAVRRELDGVFEFRGIDRKVHDTRVMQQMQGVQQLPQKVTVGK